MPIDAIRTKSACEAGSLHSVTQVPTDRRTLAGEDVFLSVVPARSNPRLVWEPGTRLGRFVIQRLLGRGSLGDVYLAEDSVDPHDVAVKIVTLGPCDEEALTSRLRIEKQIYDRIQDHRHVLKVHDIHPVRWGGSELLLLSMAYADGGTLRDWLRDHRDDPETRRVQGLSIFKQICRGVAAIHQVDVRHFDIKPENILQIGGVWKVSDFGLSSIARGAVIPPDASSLGADVAAAGTPTYMSPEQLCGTPPDDMDERSDIYSLGVVLHEILHPQCRRPFCGLPGRAGACRRSPREPRMAGIEKTVARVIRRCLAEDPDRRYASVHQLLAALKDRGDPENHIDSMWSEACQLVENNQWPQAEALCRDILQQRPGHEQANAMARDIQSRDRLAAQLYAAIEQDLDRRNLEELGTMLVEAVNTYPEHPAGQAVQVRLGLKASQYRSAMQEGLASLHSADWTAATTWFGRARDLNPNTAEAEQAARFAANLLEQIHEARQRIDQAVAVGDRDRAMSLARELDDYLGRIAHAPGQPGGQQS